MADDYADGTYRWWHLSRPSPELISALAEGWLGSGGRVLDVGCGLGTEAAHLASVGWQAVGLDLSPVALAMASAAHQEVAFVRADLRRLPFPSGSFEAAVDRGCFHYLPPAQRLEYSGELRRTLRPEGKLLLRASMYAAGVRNDIDEAVISDTFATWRIERMERATVPSDTRELTVLLVRLSVPA